MAYQVICVAYNYGLDQLNQVRSISPNLFVDFFKFKI